jgi:hypothetical protein
MKPGHHVTVSLPALTELTGPTEAYTAGEVMNMITPADICD